jgi:hypothetical protein
MTSAGGIPLYVSSRARNGAGTLSNTGVYQGRAAATAAAMGCGALGVGACLGSTRSLSQVPGVGVWVGCWSVVVVVGAVAGSGARDGACVVAGSEGAEGVEAAVAGSMLVVLGRVFRGP